MSDENRDIKNGERNDAGEGERNCERSNGATERGKRKSEVRQCVGGMRTRRTRKEKGKGRVQR